MGRVPNMDVFDFVLDEEDMAAIRKLDEKESLFSPIMIRQL